MAYMRPFLASSLRGEVGASVFTSWPANWHSPASPLCSERIKKTGIVLLHQTQEDIVIILEDGRRRRFPAYAKKENLCTNQQRIRALRQGRVEDAPEAHPFGRALLAADEASIPPALRAAARERRALEAMLEKCRAAVRRFHSNGHLVSRPLGRGRRLVR